MIQSSRFLLLLLSALFALAFVVGALLPNNLLAADEKRTLAKLIASVDHERQLGNLSSALRVFVLKDRKSVV